MFQPASSMGKFPSRFSTCHCQVASISFPNLSQRSILWVQPFTQSLGHGAAQKWPFEMAIHCFRLLTP